MKSSELKRLRSMTCVVDALSRITQPAALQNRKLSNDAEFWTFLLNASQPDRVALIADLRMSERQLVDLLTENTVGLAETYGPSWLAKHWWDIIRFTARAIAIALVAMFFFRLITTPKAEQMIAAHDLHPFMPLHQGDVIGASVRGHYVWREIAKGRTLTSQDLSTKPFGLPSVSYQVLQVPLHSSSVTMPWAPPFRADLFTSPRDHRNSARPITLKGAYVLSSATDGLLWVAIPTASVNDFASVLGTSEVYVASSSDP